MIKPEALAPNELYRSCDFAAFDFETTDDLPDLDGFAGQERALNALRFGTGVRRDGFNIFVLAPQGAGRRDLVLSFLSERAGAEPVPPDWCYVNNFEHPNKPRLLQLPTGLGTTFKDDLDKLVRELHTAIPAVFESDEYRARIQEMQQDLQHRQEDAIEAVQQEAEKDNVVLIATQGGFTLAPRRDGEVLDPQAFRALPEDERKQIEQVVERLQERLQEVLLQFPRWRQEAQEAVHSYNQEMILLAVGQLMRELRHKYAEFQPAHEHLEAIQSDLARNVDAFLGRPVSDMGPEQVLARYRVNLLVDHNGNHGAPVVFEDFPTVPRLMGRTEHYVQQGTLVTDVSLIRAGCLHRANGGYLVLDANKLLMQPMAWETLKRALIAGEVRVESLEQMYGFINTISLEPEPVPLSVKVVLIGDRTLYYLLSAYDPEFAALFKVQADFADEMPRTAESQQVYARLIATLARRHQVRPLDRSAVARVIEHASRLADDRERLTTQVRDVADLLVEADYWAGEEGSDIVRCADVQHAIDERVHRASRVQRNVDDAIQRHIIRIATDGKAVGQVNGLSVIDLGNHAFGRPARITATARPGDGQVLDIEREVDLGGAIHSKAVLIISHFLGARYARRRPLAMAASIAFEQSYGQVEGDSASVAETCALLSAVSGVPLSQALAVTGSMSQHGEVQAVGGINEKIEGFFDVCKQRGLVEGQGVLIPRANVTHLMLNEEVRQAVEEGRFRIYPLEHFDEAIELLTGMPAGRPDEQGVYPEGSFNRRVQDSLEQFAALAREARGVDKREGQRHDGA